MNNRFFEMQLFVALVERLSFTAAAEAMLITPSAASKLIKRIEERLGARLVNRTTRSIALTEEGWLYYKNVKRILQDIDETESRISSSQEQVSGTLRISAPSAFSAFHLPKILADFQTFNPLVSLDVTFLDQFVDVVEEGFDLAIRIGALPTSKVSFTILCENLRYLIASRHYVETYGMPKKISDLESHRLIDFRSLSSNGTWELLENGKSIVVPVRSVCSVNNGLAALMMCEQGMGITPAAEFATTQLFAKGCLIRVLPNCVFPSSFIYVLYASERYLSSRVRKMIDFLHFNMQLSITSHSHSSVPIEFLDILP
jgi:DNA-binding transcriptional LysR family regulator